MWSPTDFSYHLPRAQIAQVPVQPRDSSKLLVLNRQNGQIIQQKFFNLLEFLHPRDLLIFNQTKVFPARIFGKKSTGGKVELLLLEQVDNYNWQVISKPSLKVGQEINFSQNLFAKVLKSYKDTGESLLKFNLTGAEFLNLLNKIGQTPIPPYIQKSLPEKKLREKYQTVYAKNLGSAAAPTAGLHFTKELLKKIKAKGVELEFLTLHVGLGTFQPLRESNLKLKKLHKEQFEISSQLARKIKLAKKEQRRVIAVGTTTARALESATGPGWQSTQIFIYPPFKFKVVDGLITNFHLPESSLLMMVSAFVSFPNSKNKFKNFADSNLGQAYLEAVKNNYRFFSFGDGMLIF